MRVSSLMLMFSSLTLMFTSLGNLWAMIEYNDTLALHSSRYMRVSTLNNVLTDPELSFERRLNITFCVLSQDNHPDALNCFAALREHHMPTRDERDLMRSQLLISVRSNPTLSDAEKKHRVDCLLNSSPNSFFLQRCL